MDVALHNFCMMFWFILTFWTYSFWNWSFSKIQPMKVRLRTVFLVYGLIFLVFIPLKEGLCVKFGVHLIVQIWIIERFSLTFYQLCPGGAFLIAKRLSKLWRHGRNYSNRHQMSNVFLFYTCPMTFCKIAGARAVNLWMNFGRFFQELLRLFMIVVLKVAEKLPSDW